MFIQVCKPARRSLKTQARKALAGFEIRRKKMS